MVSPDGVWPERAHWYGGGVGVVYNYWTGIVEWSGGLEWWNEELHAVMPTHAHVTSRPRVATKCVCAFVLYPLRTAGLWKEAVNSPISVSASPVKLLKGEEKRDKYR